MSEAKPMPEAHDAYRLACNVLDGKHRIDNDDFEVRKAYMDAVERCAKLLLLTTEAMNAHSTETAAMLKGLWESSNSPRMDVLIRTAFARSVADFQGRDNGRG